MFRPILAGSNTRLCPATRRNEEFEMLFATITTKKTKTLH